MSLRCVGRSVGNKASSALLRYRAANHSSVRLSCNQPRQQQAPKSFCRRHKSTAVAAESAEAAGESAGSNIAPSLLAALLGVSTVSAAAAVIETVSASNGVPAYDPRGERFDQSSFTGRFCKMLLACDPRLLLYTKAQVQEYKDFLSKHENSAGSRGNDRALWEAKRITGAALHPDTGDWVPRPFRMSGYVPYNGPICVAMVSSQSTVPLLFWSWVNQSQNALVNYYNRNASSTMTNETLAKSYGAAVASALLVAFGLATAIQKNFSPARAKNLLRWVAFPSSMAASSLNCYIVRSPEIDTGIPLLDPETKTDVMPGELSRVAAAQGVYTTTASRAFLQAPVYFLPPLILAMGPLQRHLAKAPASLVPVTTYLLLTCFGIGLPASVALFPQFASINASDVETKFQHLRNSQSQQAYQTFTYNKGL